MRNNKSLSIILASLLFTGCEMSQYVKPVEPIKPQDENITKKIEPKTNYNDKEILIDNYNDLDKTLYYIDDKRKNIFKDYIKIQYRNNNTIEEDKYKKAYNILSMYEDILKNNTFLSFDDIYQELIDIYKKDSDYKDSIKIFQNVFKTYLNQNDRKEMENVFNVYTKKENEEERTKPKYIKKSPDIIEENIKTNNFKFEEHNGKIIDLITNIELEFLNERQLNYIQKSLLTQKIVDVQQNISSIKEILEGNKKNLIELKVQNELLKIKKDQNEQEIEKLKAKREQSINNMLNNALTEYQKAIILEIKAYPGDKVSEKETKEILEKYAYRYIIKNFSEKYLTSTLALFKDIGENLLEKYLYDKKMYRLLKKIKESNIENLQIFNNNLKEKIFINKLASAESEVFIEDFYTDDITQEQITALRGIFTYDISLKKETAKETAKVEYDVNIPADADVAIKDETKDIKTNFENINQYPFEYVDDLKLNIKMVNESNNNSESEFEMKIHQTISFIKNYNTVINNIELNNKNINNQILIYNNNINKAEKLLLGNIKELHQNNKILIEYYDLYLALIKNIEKRIVVAKQKQEETDSFYDVRSKLIELVYQDISTFCTSKSVIKDNNILDIKYKDEDFISQNINSTKVEIKNKVARSVNIIKATVEKLSNNGDNGYRYIAIANLENNINYKGKFSQFLSPIDYNDKKKNTREEIEKSVSSSVRIHKEKIEKNRKNITKDNFDSINFREEYNRYSNQTFSGIGATEELAEINAIKDMTRNLSDNLIALIYSKINDKKIEYVAKLFDNKKLLRFTKVQDFEKLPNGKQYKVTIKPDYNINDLINIIKSEYLK
jgi:hypothetical protein